MFKKLTIFFLSLVKLSVIFGQNIPKIVPDAESVIADLYRNQQSDDINYTDFYESLFQFYQNPLDLNNSGPDELRSIYVLNDVQIEALQQHIKEYGRLQSVYELQSIPGYTTELIRKLQPFVTVRPQEETWQGLRKQVRKPDQHYLLLRTSTDVERGRGYSGNDGNTSAYEGDPYHLYARYRIQKYKAFSAGFTLEKDAGEKFGFDWARQKPGFDFYSFHVMVYNKGRLKKLVIGDYQLQFGQGLIMSGGFFTGKGAETILTIRRGTVGIRPYTSLLETNYLRGTAATIALGRFDVTPFVSSRLADAILKDDTTERQEHAVLQYTGYHRTKSEIASRNTLLEQTGGVNTHYLSGKKNFNAGVTYVHTNYSSSLMSSPKLYNKHGFKGTENDNTGIYYSYYYRNLSLFGEGAVSAGQGKGLLQGAVFSFGPKVDFSVVYRTYSRELYTPYGNSFGENYRNNNEEGLYWGIKIRPAVSTELTAYYDTYRFPWLKYRVSAPSEGKEYLVSLKHRFSKKIIFSAQFRQESKERDVADLQRVPQTSAYIRRNFVFQADLKADKQVYFRSRVQASAFKMQSAVTYGYFISQDVGYDAMKFDLSVRAALFDTDDFENRQYAYEKDVLYAFSIPFFTGRGMRNYAVARISLGPGADLYIRYSRTTYFDRETNGSGYEEVQGSIRSEVKAQLRMDLCR